LLLGPELIGPGRLIGLIGGGEDPVASTIIFDLRLPRILLALGVGGALAATGAVFQALLKNPLAEPYILGVSNGCAVGAILGLNLPLVSAALGLGVDPGQVGVTALSFIGGLIVVMLVLWIGRRTTGTSSESMLLGGVMVAAIGAAIIFLLLALLPNVRGAIQWMLGDLGSASPAIGISSALLFLLLLIASFVTGPVLNLLALGDEQAAMLGLNVDRATVIAYLASSLVIGLAVSFCGAIGFVGLVVPHIVRRLVGPDHRMLMPMAVIAGGIFLLVCDTIARTLIPLTGGGGGELPVGAITALVGAPLFVRLLTRRG
jgi:iron complex transport system permease protein